MIATCTGRSTYLSVSAANRKPPAPSPPPTSRMTGRSGSRPSSARNSARVRSGMRANFGINRHPQQAYALAGDASAKRQLTSRLCRHRVSVYPAREPGAVDADEVRDDGENRDTDADVAQHLERDVIEQRMH